MTTEPLEHATDRRPLSASEADDAAAQAAAVRDLFTGLRAQIGRVFVGQGEVVDFVLYALLVGGHVLMMACRGWPRRSWSRTLAGTGPRLQAASSSRPT